MRLTSDRPSREGWIWSRVPLTATNWEVCMLNSFPPPHLVNHTPL